MCIKKLISAALIVWGMLVWMAAAQIIPMRKWGLAEGLPQATAQALLQDHKGYLWIGTESGLVRFDGKAFKIYQERDGLPENDCKYLAEDSTGSIWIATKRGLGCFDGKKFQKFDVNEGLPDPYIRQVSISKDNDVWVATNGGIAKYDRNTHKFTVVPAKTKKDNTINSIYAAKDGRVWAGSKGEGLLLLKNDSFELFYPNFTTKASTNEVSEDPLIDQVVNYITQDPQKRLWIGTEKGLYCWDENRKKLIHYDEIEDVVYHILYTHRNLLWVTKGQEGLLRISVNPETGKITYNHLTQQNGLPGNEVLAMCEDRTGAVWIGLYNAGFCLYHSDRFKIDKENVNAEDEVITAIAFDPEYQFHFGTHGGIYWRYNDKNIRLTVNDGLPSDRVNCIRWLKGADDKKELWVGTLSGLARFTPNPKRPEAKPRFERFTLNKSVYAFFNGATPGEKPVVIDKLLLNESVYAFCNGATADEIIFGTKDYCFKYNRKEPWRKVTVFDSTIQGPINALLPDPKRKGFWIASGTKGVGFYSFEKQSVTHYTKKNGLPSDVVNTLALDTSGVLWAGTDGGICRLRNSDQGTFEYFDKSDSLQSNTSWLLIVDASGKIWTGHESGIECVEYIPAADTGKGKIKARYYGALEGFLPREVNTNAVVRDNNNRIWFGTVSGTVCYDPAADWVNTQPPQIHIDKVLVRNQEVISWEGFDYDSINKETGLPQSLRLKYAQNSIIFHFIGLSIIAQEKVRYRYRLVGYEDEPVPVTDKTEAVYTNLSEGAYRFEVYAANADGIWTVEPVVFEFKILPPWYRTLWAYLMFALAGIGIVGGVIQWNLKRLQKQNRILEQKVAERTAEVVQKNEELGKAFEEIRTQNDILAHQKEEIESQKEHIEDSIRYALQIQTAILPQVTELTAHIPNSFILWRPAHTVSGDFYWCANIDDIVYAAAVDCTGHGVPGAFMTMIGNTLLNQIVRAEKVIYPDQILNRLHVGVRRALKQDIEGEIKSRDGMDISFIVVNKNEQKLYWAGANNPLVYVREGVLTEIKADKYPIGGVQTEAERKFTLHTIDYRPGDTFFVYSDGFQDQFGGEKGRKYMVKPFQELLRQLSISDIPVTDFGQHLDAEIVRWMAFGKGYPQRDDICIIGMRL